MTKTLTLNVLVENTVSVGGLRAEHGLAFLLRSGNRKLLFDTGQSDLLIHNACHMGLSLSALDAVVLSHGHYDHTGGFEAVGHQTAPQAHIFLHPAALGQKFVADKDGSSRSIGMKADSAEILQKAMPRVVWTTQPTEVMEGVFVTGEIPRRNHFEDTGGRFFLDADCTRPDPLLDDQALYFDTPRGLVVVLGCAHSGVVNTLEYIHELTHGRPINTVVGGMHLLSASPERIELTVEAFRHWQIQKFVPAHCTGISAIARLWLAFPGYCSACPVGSRMDFERL
jgi:7,8-dihydropterin-6-yl-methyl-4-(beta-D-ribofuranosyl)aminobenzene 5'-phosphate synthase